MRRPTALILTARYGSGHLQAAKVIAAELMNKGFDPVISDLFGESYPTIANFTQTLLNKSFCYGPTFYKWFYYGTDKLNSKGLSQFSRYLGRKRLQQLITEAQPSFVITTFPLHAAPFVIKKSRFSIPTYTVITDYCMHPYWINPLVGHYFVGSEAVKSNLINQKIKEKRITVSGIPIRLEFEKPIHREKVMEKYHLSPDKKVITVLAGALGVLKNVKELSERLLRDSSCQIIAICGTNETLYQRLLSLAMLFPESFRLVGYVNDIHEIFSVSDCLITKPGGITLTEAVAMQVPLVLFNPIPGQEAENARYFAAQGGARITRSLKETSEQAKEIVEDEAIANKMKQALKDIYKPNASSVIVNHAVSQFIKQTKISSLGGK